ncbi:DUF692 domain-containing protein [Streptomyces sp. LP05-1]|uniref:DUF692 domain-containing protein n=1 Tax=Streptomyces pyxinae TaxID=2970734 RepID=A0ABT2CDK7_9ACTN|nr:DUF692 domain-containing protein [Streptomyces sp. LP05-1]MCS0635493.1 DUF692 domain-containing protein [Streptomyces sp. LP05-1]
MREPTRLGTGIGWRPEIADVVAELPGLDWVEVVAENVCAGHPPEALVRLRERGVTVVPHGVSLGLGGADRPDAGRLSALAATATALGAPLVTEHIAFVRAGGPLTASPALEAGHLLPVPRTRDALDVLCKNVRIAQDALPVPLAVENIAALFSWPDEELTEAQFLTELVERTGVRLLIDVANLYTNQVNRGDDAVKALAALPVEAIAYVHVAGGVERDGIWHDTHAHPVPRAVLDVLAELTARVDPPGVLLERDDDFPPGPELAAELAVVTGMVAHARRAATRAEPVPAGALPAVPPAASGPATGPEVPGPVPPRPVMDEPVVPGPVVSGPEVPGARQRLGIAQTALLSALVAGTPAPEGFDRARLRVQSRALVAKRTGVVARLAPELPAILGPDFGRAFTAYAGARPMRGGYRRDALDFAERLLVDERSPYLTDPAARRRLARWWQDRAGARPPSRTARLLRGARDVLGARWTA